MDILFDGRQMEALCNQDKRARKRLGAVGAKRLRQRLDDLHAAPNLDAMRSLPGRCHELKGDRKGQLSLDLEHPLRLVFEPADTPVPRKTDGGLDWAATTAVRILAVEDTHG
jgi:proteic killer suppression protein